MMIKRALASVLAGLCMTTMSAHAQIHGAGSTFAANLYVTWGRTLVRGTPGALSYEPVGSSAGVQAVEDQRVDFGASDRPLTRAQLDQAGLVQFPVAVGGVVVAANVPGVEPGTLQLDGPALAAIYLGSIRMWNDPVLRALNPGLALPAQPITLVSRADASATSFIFTSYLSKMSEEFRKSVGQTSSLAISGSRRAANSEEIAGLVQTTRGAIGYLDYSVATTIGIPTVQMQNRWGHFVTANVDSLQLAMRSADWERMLIDPDPSFELDLTDTGCPACWPMAGATYVMLPVKGRSASSLRVLDFFEQALRSGDTLASNQGYVPVPTPAKNLVSLSMRRWRAQLEHATTGKPTRQAENKREIATVALR